MIDALVTGASGFIGKSLCARLRADGQSVLALSSVNGDVSSADTWNSLPPAKVLYQLAGKSYVPDSWIKSSDFMAVNVVGTEHALSYCRKHSTRLVLASAYVYGRPERLPICEFDRVAANNPYALSKRLAEKLSEFAAEYQGVTVTVLRIFNVFGPGQRPEFLIPKILRQVRESQVIRLYDLAPRRDYVYLSDVVDAFAKSADLKSGFRILNIGSGTSFSVGEIVEKIQLLAGTRLPVISDSVERPQEIPDVVANIELAEEVIGWRPKSSFEHGIEQILRRN